MHRTARTAAWAGLAAGVALAAWATLSYFLRYSAFDALYATVDDDLYFAITDPSAAERVAVWGGGMLAVLSAALLVGARLQMRPTSPGRRVVDDR